MRFDMNEITPKSAQKVLRDYCGLLKPDIVQQLVNVVSTSAKRSIHTWFCCYNWLSPEQVEQLITPIATDQKQSIQEWSRGVLLNGNHLLAPAQRQQLENVIRRENEIR